MRELNNEAKNIKQVRKRVEYGIDIPDDIKELFYRGFQKREVGYEMICKAKFELQRRGKWELPKVRGIQRDI